MIRNGIFCDGDIFSTRSRARGFGKIFRLSFPKYIWLSFQNLLYIRFQFLVIPYGYIFFKVVVIFYRLKIMVATKNCRFPLVDQVLQNVVLIPKRFQRPGSGVRGYVCSKWLCEKGTYTHDMQ